MIKKITAIISALVLTCSFVFAFPSFADAINTATDIIDTTRYYWGEWTDVQSILNYLEHISNGTLPLTMYEEYQDIMDNTATSSATMTNQALLAYANASTTGDTPISATIQDSYTIVAKRQIIYPYNDMVETDYIYIYVDNNQTIYSPQQFGAYGVAPNSILLVRDTNFDGVKAYSIPIAQNRITFYPNYYTNAFTFQVNGTVNGTFVYDSADSTNTVGYSSGTNSPVCPIVNNTNNSIRRSFLVDSYNSDVTWYTYFHSSGEPLTVLECLLGNCYNESMRRFMRQDNSSWALSTGYFNTAILGDYIRNNTNNNLTNYNNPAYPPVYIVPSTDPWAHGKTIDNSTINNYSDYGVTINNNQFELDVDALGAALGAAITPTFQGLLDATFSAQPDIGVSFDAGNNTNNYIDLLDDLLQNIVVYPPAEMWEPPTYEAVNTSPLVDYTYPVLPTETVPQSVIDDMGTITRIGFNALDTLGITSLLVALAVIGCVGYFVLR